MKDFFISCTSTDRPWAEWIAWVLEENGYTTRLRLWDFRLDGNIILNLHRAATPGDQQIIVLLSEQYLLTQAPIGEWPNEFNEKLRSVNFRLILILTEACQPTGALATSPAIDLTEKTETEAEQVLIESIKRYSESKDLSPQTALKVPAGVAQAQASSSSNKQFQIQRRRQTVETYLEPLAENPSIQMMQIPAGTFLMGSPADETGRQDREGPQHEVRLPTFFISKYPITQAQWQFVARLAQVKRELSLSPSYFAGDIHPVEQVSWLEAVEFCDRLSRHTSRPYRLPTEAEWEYACRANTTTPFHFGETITTDLANYNGADEQHGAYGRGPRGENRQHTTPVDHFGIANAFGLCDMHGNVWEWCQNPWRQDYGDDGSKRKTKANQSAQADHRVARGGSWYSTPERCRAASRMHFAPDSRHSDLGFRIVCALKK